MTPTEHYVKAERLLADLRRRLLEMAESGPIAAIDLTLVSATIQTAQVHATLATCREMECTCWRFKGTGDEVDPHCPFHGGPPLQPKGSTGEVRMEGAD